MKVSIGAYRKGKNGRKVRVEISRSDIWSLDYTLALVILPALKQFRKTPGGVWDLIDARPKVLENRAIKIAKKQQRVLLDKMIRAFTLIVKDCTDIDREHEIQEGLDLFAKYYRHLWI